PRWLAAHRDRAAAALARDAGIRPGVDAGVHAVSGRSASALRGRAVGGAIRLGLEHAAFRGARTDRLVGAARGETGARRDRARAHVLVRDAARGLVDHPATGAVTAAAGVAAV